ncbi:hypothetical protein B0H12DRAFT_647736 [Mycena haematopus]|nr:hypothetical protein B0H12DRAFT_647736 [Mycena haematopus]
MFILVVISDCHRLPAPAVISSCQHRLCSWRSDRTASSLAYSGGRQSKNTAATITWTGGRITPPKPFFALAVRSLRQSFSSSTVNASQWLTKVLDKTLKAQRLVVQRLVVLGVQGKRRNIGIGLDIRNANRGPANLIEDICLVYLECAKLHNLGYKMKRDGRRLVSNRIHMEKHRKAGICEVGLGQSICA